MSDYNIGVGIDSAPIVAGFREISAQMGVTQQSAVEAGNAMNSSIRTATRTAEQLNAAVRQTNAQLHGTTTTARTLENAIQGVAGEARQVGNTEPVNRFRAAWERANAFFRTGRTTVRDFFSGVREGVNDAIQDLHRYDTAAQRSASQPRPRGANGQFLPGSGGAGGGSGSSGSGAGGALAGVGDLVTGGLVTGGVVALIAGVVELGKKVVTTRAEFQKFEEVLTIALGDRSQAQQAMKQINAFAAVTPFGVKELTEDFVKLVNRGFIPTTKEMTKLGDLAASQGKSFDQLTEAVLDAQTGEFERLKEFGIKASSSGNQVTLAFGGVSKTVKKTETDIRNAILAFGDLPQVAGGMAAISKTLGGQISNLGDSVDQLFNTLGTGTQDFVANTVAAITDTVSALNSGLKDGSIAGFFEPITTGFSDLGSGLKSAYDAALTFAQSSGFFDKVTHAVDSLVEIVGGLIGGLGDVIKYLVDLYTQGGTFKTIIDNTVLLPLRVAWGLTIALVEGIRAIPFAFEAMKAGIGTAIDDIRFRFKAFIDDLEIIRLKVKQAFTFDDDKAAGLKTQIEGLEKDKQNYLSKVKNVADAAQDAFLKAEADAEAKRKARKAANPDTATTTDATITGRGITAAPTVQTDAQIKAALALQKKKNDQLIKLAQELRDAEVNALQDGYAKQQRIIINGYQTRIENVTKDKALTTEAAQQQTKVVTALEKARNAELEKLRLDHIKKEAELQAEVVKLELEGQKDSRDKQIALIDLEFAARATAITEQFKNEADLRAKALAALDNNKTVAKKTVTLNFDLSDIQTQEDAQVKNLEIIEKYGKLSVKQTKAIQLEILQIKIKAAEDTVAALLDSGKGESDAQVVNARAILNALNAEFGAAKKDLPKYDIFDLFGVNITEKDKQSLTSSFSSIMGSLTSIWNDSIQAQIDIKQKQVDLLNDAVDKMQENVDKQKDLAEQGLANNLTVAQAELDAKKAQRDKEQKDLEDLQKKQNRAAQIQIAAQGAMQVSNLILSATQIFAAHSGIPFVGVALAVAAVAAMYATFASMKAKAAELSKPASSSFRTGGEITQGKDHSQGGIKYYSPDHTNVKELQVGEYVINRDSTNKYRDVIEAINNDDLNGWLMEQLAGTGVHLADNITSDTLNMAKRVQKNEITLKAMPPAASAWNEKRLQGIEESVAFLAEKERTRKTVRETDDHIIIETPQRITKQRKQ